MNASSGDEQSFLKDLQAACLKELDDYLASFREEISELRADPLGCIAEIQKIIHSMKGNVQAVAFTQFGDYLHALETHLQSNEKDIQLLGGKLAANQADVFEFLLSNVLDAIGSYADELKIKSVDSPELRQKRAEPLDTLSIWRPKAPEATAAQPVEVLSAVEPSAPASSATSAPKAPEAAAPKAPQLPAVDSSDSPGLFLLFQNRSQYFAISIKHVVEVIKSQPLSAPPHAGENLSGLLNLRGEVLPIVKLREIMGDTLERPSYVVVSRIDDRRFGFQVEAVHQVMTLDPKDFQTVDTSGKAANSRFCQNQDRTISIVSLAEAVAA
jgi:chemotaxis signal transduction protein